MLVTHSNWARVGAVPLVLISTTLAQSEPPSRVDPARCEVLAEQLDQAFAQRDPSLQVQAIREAAPHADAKLAKKIGRGLPNDDLEVQRAAVMALRFMTNKEALSQLLKARKTFDRNDDLGSAYFLALGQHGDEQALPVLLDGAFNSKTNAIFRARIQAVGHIRSVRSVEGLIELFGKASRGRNHNGNQAGEIFDALRLLTGYTEARTADEWRKWWREHQSGFKVSEQPHGLNQRDLREYQRQWATLQERTEREAAEQERRDRRERGLDGATLAPSEA
jgi:HEAT repeat protein